MLMRLDKPAGALLLLWPGMWGLVLGASTEAQYALPVYEMLLFMLGAFIMRGAGCVINDLVDRRIDRRVARTATRPLASGVLQPWQALVLLGGLLCGGLLIAVLLGSAVLTLSFVWLPLIVLYPYMKRVTWWPQVFLGVVFNAGVLFGWVAVQKNGEFLALAPVLLYLGAICWTIAYDTIYAHQDIIDDTRVGVKSTARLFGARSKQVVGWLYAGFFVALLLVGLLMHLSASYYLVMVALAVVVAYQLYVVRLHLPRSCGWFFRQQSWVGAVITLACIVGVVG